MRRLIAILIIAASPAFAAAGAATIWQVQSTATAANANSGGFDPGATFTLTDLATDTNTANTTSPVVSSASYNFVAGDVGSAVYVSAGTHWRTGCWFTIASVASNKATLTATNGAIICRNTSAGMPTPTIKAISGTGVTSDNTATITGGTFVVDRSQTDASFASNTDLASTVGTTNPCVVTSAAYTFVATDIGNTIHISAGTNWTVGWYEIASVSAGAATLDRACGSSASISGGTWALGGAWSFGSSTSNQTDNNAISGSHIANGQRIFIKSATYNSNQTLGLPNGGGGNPITIEGYNSLRGDAPTGTARPIISLAGNALTIGQNDELYYVQVYSTSATALIISTNSRYFYSKVVNTSTTAGRTAWNVLNAATGVYMIGCEGISYRGRAFAYAGTTGSAIVIGSYFHDSDLGMSIGGTQAFTIFERNIVAGNVSHAINVPASTGAVNLVNNTLVGFPTPTGNCVNINTGTTNLKMLNNILYGCVNGVNYPDAAIAMWADFNDYYNNTTAYPSNWPAGSHSLALDPQFTSVGQYSGSSATSSTNVLTDSGANFASVVNDVDCVYLVSGTGTGFTAGIYPIHSHTSTTLTLSTPLNTAMNITSSGSGSAITYQLLYGHNFSPGTNLAGLGYPGTLAGGLSTSYVDIGAVQRQATGGGSGGQKGYSYAY